MKTGIAIRLSLVLVLLAALASAGVTTAHAAAGTTVTVSGVVTDAGGQPQQYPVLVVAGDVEQPIDLGQFGMIDGNAAVGTRTNAGIVRTDTQGQFSVSGLAAGDYWVVLIAPASSIMSPSGSTALVSFEGNALALPAELVRLTAGALAVVKFEAPALPARTASLAVSVVVYGTSDAGPRRDRVESVSVAPAVSQAQSQLRDDGTALLSNMPAGTYVVTVKTASGLTISRQVTLNGGEAGELNLILSPPEPGGGVVLPATGTGGSGARARLSMALVAVVIAASVSLIALVVGECRRASAR